MELQNQRDLNDLLASHIRVSQEFIRIWAAEREKNIAVLSTSEDLRSIIEELLELPRVHDALVASPAQAKLRRLLSSMIIEREFLGFSIISPDLVYLATTPDESVGDVAIFAYEGDLLVRVFEGGSVVSFSLQSTDAKSSVTSDMSGTHVIGPIFNSKKEVIAALVFRVNPKADLGRITKLSRFGETGETYAFDRTGRLLTGSRFESQLREMGQIHAKQGSAGVVEIRDPGGNLFQGFKPPLPRDQWPFTLAVESAVRGGSGKNLSGYRDYRGVPVVGAWVWDSRLGLGLVTEIDFREAYQGFHSTRRLVSIIFSLTVVLFLGFSATLTKALRRTVNLADEVKRNETFFRTVLDTSAIGIIMIDRDGIIQLFNKSAERMFGYTMQEVLGRNVNMLMPEPDHSNHDGYLRNYLTTNKAKIIGLGREVTACRKNGTVFPIDLAVSEVRIGTEVTFIGATRDITERKQMEIALVKARDNLESRVEKRTLELKLINEELKNFAYIVSHDLRSPLVNLKGFTGELGTCLKDIQSVLERVWPHIDEAAKRRVANIFEREVPEAMGFINASVSRMDNLINAVLQLSRIGRREMGLQSINVESLVKKILISLGHQIEKRRTRVIVGALPDVIGDPIAIEQIFSNILSNAVNYLKHDCIGVIQVSAESGEHETTFHIQDNGRGIAEDDMDKVFEVFRRAGKQDIPGEGMGLAYVKALVRRHGGTIWCESKLDVGTTFSFTISKHVEDIKS